METIPNVYSFARTVSNPAKVLHSGYWPVDGLDCSIHRSFGTVYQLNPQKSFHVTFLPQKLFEIKQKKKNGHGKKMFFCLLFVIFS